MESERLKKLENDFINEKREWEREQMEEKRLDKNQTRSIQSGEGAVGLS